MQALVHKPGRVSRGKDMWSRVYIVDDAITFFMRLHRGLAPDYFTYRKVGRLDDISIVAGRAQ